MSHFLIVTEVIIHLLAFKAIIWGVKGPAFNFKKRKWEMID